LNKSKILVLLLAVLMIISVSAVSAAEDIADSADVLAQDDSTTLEADDAVDVQADPEPAAEPAANFTTLKTEINNAGNNLTLEKDYTRVAGDNEEIEINKDFTIDGQGKYILDGNKMGRFFVVNTGSTLTLKGLTLCNGVTQDINNGFSNNGGAIFVSQGASLVVENVTFINNTAITNPTTNNYGQGGAIFSNGNVTIKEGSKFINNTANCGGAIYASSAGKLDISDSEFTGNNATVNGGAVYIKDNGKANIKNSKFSDNGGDAEYAIYNSGTLALENNTISDKIYSSTEIIKPGSNVTISPIANVTYGNPVVVYFKVENSTGYPTVNVSKKSGDLKIDYPYAVCVINNENVTVTNLTAGQYVIKIINNEDNNFAGSFDSAVFNVTKADPNLQVTAKVDAVGIIEIDATVDKNVTGNITFKVINETGAVVLKGEEEIENGSAKFAELSVLPKGKYNYTVFYKETDNYVNSTLNSETPLVVDKEVAHIDIKTPEVNEYGMIVIKANITKDATGNVTFYFYNIDTGKNLTVPIEIGENGTIDYNELTPFEKGYYHVQIGYNGDDKYYETIETSASVDVNVTKTTSILNVYNVTVNQFGHIVVLANVTKGATGNVTYLFTNVGTGKTLEVNITVDEDGVADYDEMTIFDKGEYKINVWYNGDENYYATPDVEESVEITKTNATLDVYSVSVNEFGHIVVLANLTKGATGNVTYLFTNVGTGKTLEVNITVGEDGVADYDEMTIFDKGEYKINVWYNGDENYYATLDVEESADVNKTAPAIDVYVSSIENNVTVKVIADNNTVNGKVNITLFKNGTEYANVVKNMTNGVVEEFNFTEIEIGDYLVRADFLGSDDFYQTFAVNETKVRASTEMNVTMTVNQFGQIVVAANLTKGATGTVLFIITNSSGDNIVNLTAEIDNGTAQDWTTDVLAKGFYSVKAIYSGDDHYATTPAFAGGVEIDKEYLNVTSKVSIMDGANQATIVFTFSGNASGNATAFFLNYGTNATYAIQNGTVVIDEIFDNGLQSVLLTYDGDDKYYGFYDVHADFFVKTSSFISAKDVNVVYQNNGKVTVTLYDNNDGKGKNPIANAEIVITLNGKQYKATTNSKGIATVTIAAKLVPKKYTATVSYAGTNVTVGDKETFKFTVKKATPKLTAKKKTFKAKTKTKKYTIVLKDNKNKAMKKVKVYLKVKGKTYTAKTNSKGKAVFKIKKLTKKGTYKAKVTFKGNKYFNKVVKTAKIKVKR